VDRRTGGQPPWDKDELISLWSQRFRIQVFYTLAKYAKNGQRPLLLVVCSQLFCRCVVF